MLALLATQVYTFAVFVVYFSFSAILVCTIFDITLMSKFPLKIDAIEELLVILIIV